MTTLWKSEHSPAFGFGLHSPGQYLELPILTALAAALGLLIFQLVPPPLVMPALSLVSFTIAMILALRAYCTRVDLRAHGITLWDAAGVFALIWIGAGTLSEPEHIIQLFDHIMMVQ
jgi:hypothetical protein